MRFHSCSHGTRIAAHRNKRGRSVVLPGNNRGRRQSPALKTISLRLGVSMGGILLAYCSVARRITTVVLKGKRHPCGGTIPAGEVVVELSLKPRSRSVMRGG